MNITLLDAIGRPLELTQYLNGNKASDKLYILLENRPALALLLVGAILGNQVKFALNGTQPQGSDTVVKSLAQDVTISKGFLWLNKSTLEQFLPQIAELPYKSRYQLKTTIHHFPKIRFEHNADIAKTFSNWNLLAWNAPYIAFVSGSVDELLNASRWILVNGWVESLDNAWHAQIMARHNQFRDNRHILGVAFQPLVELPSTNGHSEKHKAPDLIFIGMIATTIIH
jgi:Ca2+-transporting ATPase